MIRTPTYWLFDMYQKHMDAQLVRFNKALPHNTTGTASKKNGQLTISLGNYDLKLDQDLEFTFDQDPQKVISAQIITADKMDAHNTFDHPDNVILRNYQGYRLKNGLLKIKLPAKSVVSITVE